MTILVTGGAGFIGSNFVLDWLAQSDETLVNLDALTYAGNLDNLASLNGDARHIFVKGDKSEVLMSELNRIVGELNGIINTINGVNKAITGDEILYKLKN